MASGIGETLRTTRRQQRLSLADAASEIRVREPYLAALEDEKFAKLGGDVYVRAFLRGYSEFLGLDPDQIVEAYRRDFERGGRTRPDAPVAALPASSTATSQWESVSSAPVRWEQPPAPAWNGDEPGWDDEPRRSFFPRAIILAGVVLLLLVVAVLGLRGRQATVAQGDPATATVVIPTVQPSVEAEQPTAEAAPAPEPTAAPTETAVTPTPAPSVAAPVQAPLDALNVELRVVEGPSWLRVTADGSVVEVGIFEPGTTFTWAPDDSMTLRVGDASNVRVVLNGVDQGVLGAERQALDVEYRIGELPTVTPLPA